MFQYLILSLFLLYLFLQSRRLSIFLRRSFELSIEPHLFKIYIKDCFNNRHIQGNPRDLQVLDDTNLACSLQYKKQRLKLDPMDGYSSHYLTEIEKRWMHQEISNFMEKWDLF